MFIIMDIGCIECGASSNIVGKFATEEQANKLASHIQRVHGRQGEEHRFEVFQLPDNEGIFPEYVKYVEGENAPR
jgi:hypothetical protein